MGFAFGLVGRFLFATFQFAGQIIGEQIGFHTAQMVDPTQTAQLPTVGQLLFIASLLVFFAIDAHHVFFEALAKSFDQTPPGSIRFAPGLAAFFVEQGARMFVIAVQLSMPIMAVGFVVNVGMGLMTRAVPRMHVFVESFPIRILIGLFMLGIVITIIVRAMVGLLGQMQNDMDGLSNLLGG
ncbi:flagellar biosynthetic protein FliR [bacterium]|nr:flagellar biosynthetic protein FliR [bacterium]